ncbi:TonB family protein [Persicitalea sp.]|uniref:TonB family protein n=1 Tax=Persicitalea sp. TaxID=3100273 RepID=UPI00359468E8
MKALLVLSSFFTLPVTWAQNTAFEGFVYDEQDQPIEDAMVSVLNMGRPYAVTDATGYFSLDTVEADDSLVIDHVAYSRIYVAVDNQKRVIVKLPRSQERLLSFTMVEYSTQDDSDLISQTDLSPEDRKWNTLRKPASYLEGNLAMVKFLAKTISYPTEAARNDIQGMVEASFVVNKNGDVRSPRIVKSLGYGCDEEVIKAVLNMPRWIPGIQNGKTVDVPFTLPVWFALKEKPNQSLLPDSTVSQKAEPVFMLHGKIVEGKEIGDGLQGFGIKKLDAFKGKLAVDQFGDSGRSGFVLITPNSRN